MVKKSPLAARIRRILKAISAPAQVSRPKPPLPRHLLQGRRAETHAAACLGQQGIRIIARNVRCRHGEIDLIGLDGESLVFVEVRLRTNPDFGSAGESITPQKQHRIITAARWLLASAGRTHQNRVCRFDAVLYDKPEAGTPEWIKSAFELSGQY